MMMQRADCWYLDELTFSCSELNIGKYFSRFNVLIFSHIIKYYFFKLNTVYPKKFGFHFLLIVSVEVRSFFTFNCSPRNSCDKTRTQIYLRHVKTSHHILKLMFSFDLVSSPLRYESKIMNGRTTIVAQ